MSLPPDLLNAISKSEGGQVVLIVGAGCSKELPTNLPLSRELAWDTHRKLVEDGILSSEDCTDPENLSCVADAVWDKFKSQKEIVARFPNDKLRQAVPNIGHIIAAAMLHEYALSCVMTLNFDLALTNALSRIGTEGSVRVISKPEDYVNLGLSNIVYLHRNVDADPDLWVLRSEVLEKSW